ncbi:MAG: phosphoribosylglycinamide formyltransferase [Desulfobacteraceae bacterium]
MNIGFLASHNGSNMQAIIDACNSGALHASPVVVISNNSKSGALERAKKESIAHYHISGKNYPDPGELDRAILNVMKEHSVDIIVLAGYMKKLGSKTLAYFQGRILNIHPALLPKYGGKGMYGMNVHEAVIEAGETESGVSIHIVDSNYDTGPVIAQARVPVKPMDTCETLAARVLEQEHLLFPETLQKIVTGEIKLPILLMEK